MVRVPDVDPDSFTSEQKRVHDEVAGLRHGAVRGPFALWMRMPAVAEQANRLADTMKNDAALTPQLYRLAVLVVARHWGAQYEWYVHEKGAREAGIPEAAIEAIRTKRVPTLDDLKLAMGYEVLTELNETKAICSETYARAEKILGIEPLIGLVSVSGLFTMIAMVLNAFEAPVPGDARPLPD